MSSGRKMPERAAEALHTLGRYSPTSNEGQGLVKGQTIVNDPTEDSGRYMSADDLRITAIGLLEAAEWLDERRKLYLQRVDAGA